MCRFLPERELNVFRTEANIATSDTNIATSNANIATSDDNIATSDSNMATSSPNKQYKKRLSADEMRAAVVEIAREWVTLDEIAYRLGRNKAYVRSFVIPNLLTDKTIEMLYPDTPNHPSQKYKKKE